MTAIGGAPHGPSLAAYPPPTGQALRWPFKLVEAKPLPQAISVGLTMVSGVLLVLLVNLTLVSQLQHLTSQVTLYQQVRLSLAQGSTPISPVGKKGVVVPLGTPVAVMKAPTVGIGHEVIVEGSGSSQTMEGIGHRRDTVMPCQVGTSELLGRAASYGGIGNAWQHLQNGDRFTITMGQGACTYQVVDHRVAGQKAPPLPTGRAGMLTLVTATGPPFAPMGVLRIDTALVSNSFDRSDVAFPQGSLPSSELPLGVDTSQLFPLTMLAEAIVAVAIAGTWLWRRWSRVKAWIVVAPIALAVLFLTAQCIDDLLPNII